MESVERLNKRNRNGIRRRAEYQYSVRV